MRLINEILKFRICMSANDLIENIDHLPFKERARSIKSFLEDCLREEDEIMVDYRNITSTLRGWIIFPEETELFDYFQWLGCQIDQLAYKLADMDGQSKWKFLQLPLPELHYA